MGHLWGRSVLLLAKGCAKDSLTLIRQCCQQNNLRPPVNSLGISWVTQVAFARSGLESGAPCGGLSGISAFWLSLLYKWKWSTSMTRTLPWSCHFVHFMVLKWSHLWFKSVIKQNSLFPPFAVFTCSFHVALPPLWTPPHQSPIGVWSSWGMNEFRFRGGHHANPLDFFCVWLSFRILGIAGLDLNEITSPCLRTDVQSWPPTAAVVMSKIVLIATGTSSNYLVYILPNAVLKSWKQTNLVMSPEYHAKNGRRRT